MALVNYKVQVGSYSFFSLIKYMKRILSRFPEYLHLWHCPQRQSFIALTFFASISSADDCIIITLTLIFMISARIKKISEMHRHLKHLPGDTIYYF